MPLLLNVLQDELSKIMDNDYPAFIGFGNSQADIASKWAEAVGAYAQTVLIPSTNISGAKSAMESIIASITPAIGLVLFPQAFTAFALQLSLGMVTPAFSALPPPVPIVLDPVWQIPTSVGSNQARVAAMTTIIDTWFRTGTYTSIPAGVTSFWS
jgi:hypothetical protein